MKIMALIPARSGSKRVKDKNIRILGTIPLLAWSILTAKQCPAIKTVYVSTDSCQYQNITTHWGSQWTNRPENLASDQAIDFDVISHFLKYYDCDFLVYLRPTTPFRTASMIEEAIRLMSVPGYDSLRSIEEMGESAYKTFRIKAGILQPLTRKDFTDKPNQLLPKTYKPNGYIDIVRPEIVAKGSLWGKGRYAFVTPRTCEIDTVEDFEYAEYLITKGRVWSFGVNKEGKDYDENKNGDN